MEENRDPGYDDENIFSNLFSRFMHAVFLYCRLFFFLINMKTLLPYGYWSSYLLVP